MGLMNAEKYESGGFLDDVDVEIKDAKCIIFTFRDKDTGEPIPWERDGQSGISKPACMIAIDFELEDGKISTQRYGVCGFNDKHDTTRFCPSDDWETAVDPENPLNEDVEGSCFCNNPAWGGTSGYPNEKARFVLFHNALKELAPGLSDLESAKQLIGLKGHLVALPVEKSKNPVVVFASIEKDSIGAGAQKAAGKKGGKKGGKKPAAAASGSAEATSDNPEEFNEEELGRIINEIATAEEDGQIPKRSIAVKLAKYAGKPKSWKKKATSLAQKDDFLGADERPFLYADGIITGAVEEEE